MSRAKRFRGLFGRSCVLVELIDGSTLSDREWIILKPGQRIVWPAPAALTEERVREIVREEMTRAANDLEAETKVRVDQVMAATIALCLPEEVAALDGLSRRRKGRGWLARLLSGSPGHATAGDGQ